MLRVAYLCEYTTVNGGENSLLTFLATAVESIQATVLCPSEGPFVQKLRTQGVQCVPFDVRDCSGQRKPLEQIVVELCTLLRGLMLISYTATVCPCHGFLARRKI